MRIWTFGCSYTQYYWPTWADMLIHEAEVQGHEGFNLGSCGKSNQFIASRIWECNAKYKFTKDDWIFICWTVFYREDRYLTNKGWRNLLQFKDLPFSDNISEDEYKMFITNWMDPMHYAIRDCMLITSTIKGLESIGVNVLNWTMNPYVQPKAEYNWYIPQSSAEIVDIYKPSFSFPSMMEFTNTVTLDLASPTRIPVITPMDDKIVNDFHPLPSEHYGYLKEHICNKVPWAKNLSESTVSFANYWEEKIKDLPKPVLLTHENTGWSSTPKLDLWW